MGVIVSGTLRGRERWKILNSDVKLDIIASSQAQRDKWVSELRFRIAPWEGSA